MTLKYNTRDGKGNDIAKNIIFKDFPIQITDSEFTCGFCGVHTDTGVKLSDAVSGSFTDWNYLKSSSFMICRTCAQRLNLYKYSYIINGDDIRLLNVREMAAEIVKPQITPFMVVVSKSQKKHLFYKAVTNYDNVNFTVNLEEEQIPVSLPELQELFRFVGALQALGESKLRLSEGNISMKTMTLFGRDVFSYLNEKLMFRPIQIPLYLSQKPEISEEKAISCINSILNR